MNPSGHPFAVIGTFACCVCGAHAAGVAALKEQPYHRDSSAKTLVYSQIIDSHGPYLRIVSGKVNVDILRQTLAGHLDLPDRIPASVIEDKDIAPLRRTLADIREFTTRYPQSAPLLEKPAAALAAHVGRFDAGEVRFEGAWISKAHLASLLEIRRREDHASELAEVEKRVFAASQHDKGLVLHNGRWMSPQEIGQLPPGSPTELSDCIEPLWNGDFSGARFAVHNLANLAATQTGASKVRTQRLMAAVRNLFLAEYRLSQQILASTSEAGKAAVHEKNARDWLKPNAFGHFSTEAAADSRRKALQIRQRSADQLAACKGELREQLHQIDVVTGDFQKLREQRVALTLHAASRAVASRHFTEAELQPAAADGSLAANKGPDTGTGP